MKAVEIQEHDDTKNSRGHSPLHSAAADGHTETVKALLIGNSDACLIPNQNGLIPLHLAARRGRIDVVQELVRACPESVQVKLQGSQETVLHLCVKYNQMDVLKFLVKNMIGDPESLNSADSEGNTIWQLALMMKQTEIIRFLASIPEVRVETNDFLDLEPTRQKHKNNGPAEGQAAEPVVNKVTGYFEKQRKAIKSRRGELMIVTTVIASMAFQAAINPPGGVWQADTENCNGVVGRTCKAGKSVWSYTNKYGHHLFITSNTVCFCTSLGVIFLLIGLPLKNWFTMGLLLIAMCASILFMAATYVLGVLIIGDPDDDAILRIFIVYALVWVGLLVVIVVFQAGRFLYWAVKKLCVALSHCLGLSRKAPADVPPPNRV